MWYQLNLFGPITNAEKARQNLINVYAQMTLAEEAISAAFKSRSNDEIPQQRLLDIHAEQAYKLESLHKQAAKYRSRLRIQPLTRIILPPHAVI